MALPTLKIHQQSARLGDWRVWLDDAEITAGLTGVSVRFDCDDITVAEFSVLLDGVEINAQGLATLTAHAQIAEEVA